MDDIIKQVNSTQALEKISPFIRTTPLEKSLYLSEIAGQDIYLKLENQQVTGAFKVRGAFNKLQSLTKEQQKHGVVTISTGNHGIATAYAGMILGISVKVCIPESIPKSKLSAIKHYDAEPVLFGNIFEERKAKAKEIEKEEGRTFIHSFDDLKVIEGQGTIGVEILRQINKLDTFIAPLSGGGLLSGIAIALKKINPSIRIIGVSQELGAAMHESIKMGKLTEVKELPTLASAISGNIGQDNKYTFQLVNKLVDEYVLVSEKEIAEGIKWMVRKHHMITEGGAVVGVSALLSKKIKVTGNTAVLLTGCNIDYNLLLEVLESK